MQINVVYLLIVVVFLVENLIVVTTIIQETRVVDRCFIANTGGQI